MTLPLNVKQCFGNTRYMQYLAAIIVTLAIPSGSIYTSWLAPALPKLNSTDSPIERPITDEEGSWIAATHSLAVLPSGLIIIFIIERISRKYLLLSGAVLMFFPWFLCIFANSSIMIIVAQFIGGFASGIGDILVPIYVGEIAEKDIRGRLGVLFTVLKLIGTLVVYCTGPFVTYTVLTVICSIFPLVFFILFCFMPESPYYLVKNGQLNKAEENLLKLSNSDASSKKSMEIVVNTINFDMQNKASFWQLFSESKYRKPLLIVLCIKTFQQLSGNNAINPYMQIIIKLSGSSISPEITNMISGVVQIPAVLVAAALIDKVGRKPLWVISSVGCSIALLTEGTYFYLYDALHKDVQNFAWLPTAALILYLILSPVGLITLPYIIMGELFSTNIKGKAASICIFYGSTLSFIVIKLFQPLSEAWGMYTMFWIYGCITFLGAVVVYIILPETKGKTFLEIQEMLNRKEKLSK